eukprot:1158562-Pelagomonas_calceolata.AAC.13
MEVSIQASGTGAGSPSGLALIMTKGFFHRAYFASYNSEQRLCLPDCSPPQKAACDPPTLTKAYFCMQCCEEQWPHVCAGLLKRRRCGGGEIDILTKSIGQNAPLGEL